MTSRRSLMNTCFCLLLPAMIAAPVVLRGETAYAGPLPPPGSPPGASYSAGGSPGCGPSNSIPCCTSGWPCPYCGAPPCPPASSLPPVSGYSPPSNPSGSAPSSISSSVNSSYVSGPMPPWLNNCLSPRGSGVGEPSCDPDGYTPSDPYSDPGYSAQSMCPFCECIIEDGIQEQETIQELGLWERDTFEYLMFDFEHWIVTTFFDDYIKPAMMGMAEFMSSFGMYQVEVFGMLLDAKDQMETERLMQQFTAEAHARYQPDVEMCTIGTVARGFAAAYRDAEYNAFALAQRSQDRQLGSINQSAGGGRPDDRVMRTQQFKTTFCDVYQNNDTLGSLCGAAPASPISTNRPEMDRDVRYTSLIDEPFFIDVDFTVDKVTGKQKLTDDEKALLAMENYLFAHNVFDRLGVEILKMKGFQPIYLDARAVVAKRSVAENSFLAIAGMKTSSPSNNMAVLASAIMKQMGVTGPEAFILTGAEPSYYDLLDLIGRRLYQVPEFYVQLYDTPANVARKDVAMQAIDLMVGRDMFKSELRSEADMAVWLELEIIDKQQNPIQNHLNWLSDANRKD